MYLLLQGAKKLHQNDMDDESIDTALEIIEKLGFDGLSPLGMIMVYTNLFFVFRLVAPTARNRRQRRV
jgi:hypothetical protein